MKAAALLLALAAAAAASDLDKEFSSADRKWRLSVSYSTPNGAGPSKASLLDAAGKKISEFSSKRSPFSVSIAPGGRRLIYLCGTWGQSVSVYAIDVYDAAGRLLMSHQAEMQGPAGEDFSPDGAVYAVAADSGRERVLYVIDTGSGRLRWKKSFQARLNGIKLSGDGRRLLALFGEAGRYRAEVFGKDGKSLGSAQLSSRGELSPRAFSADGGEFELWEGRSVYSEKDGYWHARLARKYYFKVKAGGVEAAGSREFDEPFFK